MANIGILVNKVSFCSSPQSVKEKLCPQIRFRLQPGHLADMADADKTGVVPVSKPAGRRGGAG
jgi:hypothetical protein